MAGLERAAEEERTAEQNGLGHGRHGPTRNYTDTSFNRGFLFGACRLETNQLTADSCGLSATACQLRPVSYGLSATACQLRPVSYGLSAESSGGSSFGSFVKSKRLK